MNRYLIVEMEYRGGYQSGMGHHAIRFTIEAKDLNELNEKL